MKLYVFAPIILAVIAVIIGFYLSSKRTGR